MNHVTVALPDGRVLVHGGGTEWEINLSGRGHMVGTYEIWDPVTDRWTEYESPRDPHVDEAFGLLGDGRVLIVGGRDVRTRLQLGRPSSSTDAWLFDPATNEWERVTDSPLWLGEGVSGEVDGRIVFAAANLGLTFFDPED